MHKRVVKHVGRKRPSSAGYERKKKMTINEFIYRFDEGSTYAEYDEQGNVYIYDKTYDTMMARLGIDSSVWEVEDDGFVMSPSSLRLMAELADTPPAKRKETPKYVILNGLPRHGTCYFFVIDEYSGRLLPCYLDEVDEDNVTALETYSEKRLHESKKSLTPELAAAVDMMKVTLERAIELTEKSKYEDLG